MTSPCGMATPHSRISYFPFPALCSTYVASGEAGFTLLVQALVGGGAAAAETCLRQTRNLAHCSQAKALELRTVRRRGEVSRAVQVTGPAELRRCMSATLVALPSGRGP